MFIKNVALAIMLTLLISPSIFEVNIQSTRGEPTGIVFPDYYPMLTGSESFAGNWTCAYDNSLGYPFVDFAVCNGKLYAATNNKLHVYDGISWNVIDAPAFVTSLESYEGKLYVGAQGGLYSFDGATYNLIFTVPTYIKVLGVYNNILYAGTMLDRPPTLYYCNSSADNPADWHIDNALSAILSFSGSFGSIDSFAEYSGNLYVASGGTVYCYNETGWSNANISYEYAEAYLDMTVYDGKLYLATRDKPTRIPPYLGGSGFSGVIVEFDGTNWNTILGHDYWIYSLESYGDTLYVGTANRIYTYNGTSWDVSFYSQEGAYYTICMTVFDSTLYAGMGNGYIFSYTIAATANLAAIESSTSAYRWLDSADQAYGSDYRNSYNYSQATVTVTYFGTGSTLTGKLVAQNLKPNFAYQLKLVGTPGTADNEQIGFAGRWWQEEWNGISWSNGQNLNNKGNGSSPNPNDLVYLARRSIEDSSSPTGYHYRYTGYIVFAYFITDQNGDATIMFETGDCYHVLWKTSQRTHTANDGPIKTATFDPDPSQPAYDTDYPSSTVSIFGEWERLPIGGVDLSPGQYNCQIVLTEESFHGMGPLAGNWAAAMSTEISFMILE